MRTVTDSSGAPLWRSRADAVEQPTPWLWLAILTALAVLLRAIGLNGGLWWDEIYTLVASVRSPLRQIVTVFPGDNQHTLFSVLAHLSITAFGEHAWSLRLPAMLLGAATVPVLYLFAREIVGRTEALLASLLLTVAYHHVWFSQNARGYSTLALLALLSSWLLLRGLRRGRTSDFVWYGVVSALGAYTHLTMVLLVVSHAVLCMIPLGVPGLAEDWFRRWRLPVFGFVVAGVLTLLLYAPVLIAVRHSIVKEASAAPAATPRWAMLELLRGLRIGLGSVAGLLVGATLFVFGLRSYLKQSVFLVGMFLLPGAVILAAVLALHRPVRPRFAFFLIGFGLLIVVRGALEIGRLLLRRPASDTEVTSVGFGLVVAMALLSAISLPVNYRYPKQDFEGAMRFVDAERADRDQVATAGGAIYPYREYYRRPWLGLDSLAQFRSVRSQGNRVWVLYTLKKNSLAIEAPDLLRALEAECVIARVFRGTVGDGDITVCTASPTAP
jgi:4-amino-4-deoxy-L-arabinose transferase-like glycosyltransferase